MVIVGSVVAIVGSVVVGSERGRRRSIGGADSANVGAVVGEKAWEVTRQSDAARRRGRGGSGAGGGSVSVRGGSRGEIWSAQRRERRSVGAQSAHGIVESASADGVGRRPGHHVVGDPAAGQKDGNHELFSPLRIYEFDWGRFNVFV